MTAVFGVRSQLSANAHSYQLCQLFCCSAIFVGSVTLPEECPVTIWENCSPQMFPVPGASQLEDN